MNFTQPFSVWTLVSLSVCMAAGRFPARIFPKTNSDLEIIPDGLIREIAALESRMDVWSSFAASHVLFELHDLGLDHLANEILQDPRISISGILEKAVDQRSLWLVKLCVNHPAITDYARSQALSRIVEQPSTGTGIFNNRQAVIAQIEEIHETTQTSERSSRFSEKSMKEIFTFWRLLLSTGPMVDDSSIELVSTLLSIAFQAAPNHALLDLLLETHFIPKTTSDDLAESPWCRIANIFTLRSDLYSISRMLWDWPELKQAYDLSRSTAFKSNLLQSAFKKSPAVFLLLTTHPDFFAHLQSEHNHSTSTEVDGYADKHPELITALNAEFTKDHCLDAYLDSLKSMFMDTADMGRKRVIFMSLLFAPSLQYCVSSTISFCYPAQDPYMIRAALFSKRLTIEQLGSLHRTGHFAEIYEDIDNELGLCDVSRLRFRGEGSALLFLAISWASGNEAKKSFALKLFQCAGIMRNMIFLCNLDILASIENSG